MTLNASQQGLIDAINDFGGLRISNSNPRLMNIARQLVDMGLIIRDDSVVSLFSTKHTVGFRLAPKKDAADIDK